MAIFVKNISTHTVEVELPGRKCLRLGPQEICEVESTDCKSPLFRRLVNRSVLEEFTSEQVSELKKKAINYRRKLKKKIAKTKIEAEKKNKEPKEKVKKAKPKTKKVKKTSPQKKKTGTPRKMSTTKAHKK